MWDRCGRFPNTDPHQLWILMAGRAVSLKEAKQWIRLLFGGRKLLPIIAFITVLFFMSDMMYSMSVGKYTVYEKGLFITVLPAVVFGMAMLFWRILFCPGNRMLAEFAEYEADTARKNSTVRIAFYGEYVMWTSIHTNITLRYEAITVCVESENGFLLGDGVRYLIIRAADLTPYLANTIRAYLSERLDPRVIRFKRSVKVSLRQPIEPIPQYAEPTVLTTAQISEKPKNRCSGILLGLAATIGVYVALGMTVWFPFSPWFFMNLLCYVVGSVVAAMGFACFVAARYADRKRNTDTVLSFEEDGLRIMSDGNTQFYTKERVWLAYETEGVRIRLANADIVYVPYDAVEDCHILRALSGTPLSE